MTDPVIGPDGITYERRNIERWLTTNSTSPMTREPMPSGSLIPNLALKHTIASWLSVNPERTGQPLVAPALPVVPSFTKHPLEIKASIYNNRELYVDLIPPQTAERQPICFLAILDNSGSMGELATRAEGTGNFGFTRMDLTKHAAHTILEMLLPHDMFALVTFSTEAHIVLQPTYVTDTNKTRIKSAIDNVQPQANTNIYDGIRKAASIANLPEMTGKHIVAMMMTDGYPNIDPPRGILPSLATMRMTNPWTLHTFGFGYNLDSQLLEKIAKWGNGLFGFIPDCSMVGTVFINFLAHMLSVVVPNAELTYTVNLVDGTTKSTTVQVGTVISGQTRHILLPIEVDGEPQSVSVNYDGVNHIAQPVLVLPEFVQCYTEYKRLLRNLIEAKGCEDVTKPLLDAFVHTYNTSTNEGIKSIVRDVQSDTEGEGQIGMASSRVHFERWGGHYMRAYLRSQELQQCMNFKDPGLQIYGGPVFRSIQTDADTIFCTLPPPKPSGRAISFGNGTPASMSIFHNASSGCFHGINHIQMADGSFKQIKDVHVGDHVKTPDGSACIRYVVECHSSAKSQPMTQYGELSITPWHPIRVGGEWKFPAQLASYTSRLIDVVYNFVLDKDHIVIVGGIECCTLGHGFKGPVIEHAYFGESVVMDIREKAGGIEYGRVVYENLKTLRDPFTNEINGWFDAP